jgi:DNA mismatch endonuclease (patch repair protein)
MDVVTRETRSKMMASVRSKDTKPEKKVRSLLHVLGYRFRIHRKDLPGNPDIVLVKYKKVIFVHGCFWHQHIGCPKAKRPNTRKEFWDKKLNQNIERDKRNLRELEELGWVPYIIWECETRREAVLISSVEKIFDKTNGRGKT